MRWLADECVSRSIVNNLRARGDDVLFAADQLSGKPDTFILDLANAEDRFVLTQDSDYGELLFGRPSLRAFGIVFLRIPFAGPDARWRRLAHVLDLMGDDLQGRFVVVTESRIRWRPIDPPA